MLQINYFKFIIKKHIFYDTYSMYLIYEEIEQKKWIDLGHNTKNGKNHYSWYFVNATFQT